MSGRAGERLHELLDAAFVRCEEPAVAQLVHACARIRDSHLADPTRHAFLELVSAFRHALLERQLVVSTSLADDQRAMAHFSLVGVHVGVMLDVVPVGRRVCIEGSATARFEHGRVVELDDVWATATLLRTFGLKDAAASRIEPYSTSVRPRAGSELLSGCPERTHWARAWKLSPFLARTAVLVMAGLDGRAMSQALGVTTATARTYVRELYAATGVHGRLPLLRAAHALASPDRTLTTRTR